MYDIEQYYNAKTVSEAVMLLKEHPDARIISGGSDVLIKIREGRMQALLWYPSGILRKLKVLQEMRTGIF